MLFRIDIASPKPVQVDFCAHILDSNMFIFFKFDTVINIWAKSELNGLNRSVCNCVDTYFRFLSNQKPSLCHGINCSSYEIGTLAIAVHWEMNTIAPYGFIVEVCSRGVNI